VIYVSDPALAELVRRTLRRRITRGTWELLEQCYHEEEEAAAARRSRAGDSAGASHGGGALPPEAPVRLVEPASPEEAAAAEAEAVRRRLQRITDALYASRAPRAPGCGRGRVLHIRRNAPGSASGAVDAGLIRPSCGRSTCPHCWRKRLRRTYGRAAGCLLDESADSCRPRVGMLHVAEADWSDWEALDKAIRRRYGGCVGRVRVRCEDDNLIVVCELPFPGSRPVSPAQALDLVSAAVGRLHRARHSYRQLGDWSDGRPSEWRLCGCVDPAVDLGDVRALLEEMGRRARHLRSDDLEALLWRCSSEADADALFAGLGVAGDVSDFRQRGERYSHWTNSDTDSGGGDPVWENPFD
jgi:hypothetical protein